LSSVRAICRASRVTSGRPAMRRLRTTRSIAPVAICVTPMTFSVMRTSSEPKLSRDTRSSMARAISVSASL
jgi:hypothetical protein